jgi:UDP-N-acetyl-2-amino-2-deoxyglucuronate dehydrogenase
VDLLTWLFGPVQTVQAFTDTLGRDIAVEDTGVMIARFRSGALASMNVTMLTYLKNLEGSITVIGEKGTVRLGGVALNQIEHWEFEDLRANELEDVKKANYQITSVYGNSHVPFYQNVLDTLQGKAEADTDGREGLKSMELLVSLYLAARNNRPVSLPLDY